MKRHLNNLLKNFGVHLKLRLIPKYSALLFFYFHMSNVFYKYMCTFKAYIIKIL